MREKVKRFIATFGAFSKHLSHFIEVKVMWGQSKVTVGFVQHNVLHAM